MWNRDKLDRYAFMTCRSRVGPVLFGCTMGQWYVKPFTVASALISTKGNVMSPERLVDWLNEQEARPLAWVGEGVI